MNDSIHSCISPDDVSLRVDAVGVGVGADGKIKWNTIAIDCKSTVSVTIRSTITAHHATLRVEAAEKRKGRTGAIDGLDRTSS